MRITSGADAIAPQWSLGGRIVIRIIVVVLALNVLAGHALLADNVDIPTGQDPVRRFVLIDGSELIGRVLKQDGDQLQVLTLNGEIRAVFAQDILSQNDADSIVAKDTYRVVRGEIWGKNANRTRHFWSPSSFPLMKGESYLSQKQIATTIYASGLTDNIGVMAASVLPALLAGADWFNLAGAVKIADKVTENVHVSAGAEVLVVGMSSSFSDKAAVALPFVGFTVGEPDRQFSVNLGAAFHRGILPDDDEYCDDLSSGGPLAPMEHGRDYEDCFDYDDNGDWYDDIHDGVTPMFSISGMIRVTKTFGLVTENLFFPGWRTPGSGWGVFSLHGFAIRRLGERNAWDFGFVTNFTDGNAIVIPWLEYMWQF